MYQRVEFDAQGHPLTPVFDGDWRLYRLDPETGIQTWMIDKGDGTFAVRKLMPVDELMDLNALERSANAGTKHGDMAKVASIPLNYWYKYLAQANAEGDEKYIAKWLNDPDHRKFRTRESKI